MIEARLGTNPYKFGVVGATDSHTSLATAQRKEVYGTTGPRMSVRVFGGWDFTDAMKAYSITVAALSFS